MGPRWPRGERGRRIAARLLRTLRRVRDAAGRWTEDDLEEVYRQLGEFYESTHSTGEELGVQCARGCSNCCHQMVYGVHSFEAERIGRRIESEGRAAEIRRKLAEREDAYASLTPSPSIATDDETREEAQALAFFALGMPCVFLDAEGACSIHDVRPYACRRFFSLSSPDRCTAVGVQSGDYRGLMFEPSEHVDRAMAEADARAGFRAASDRLDAALLEWFASRDRGQWPAGSE